jgi:sortase A
VKRSIIQAIQLAALAAGLLLLGRWTATQVETREFQHRASALLDRATHPRWSGPRATRTREQARTTGVVGRLSIPRLKVAGVIAEGVADKTLDRAIGHVPGTPYPGEAGNFSLAGHRDTFFRGLRSVRKGDRIKVKTADGSFTYKVSRMRVVSPRSVSVLRNQKKPTLTLVTCYPFNYIGPAPQRWVVQADLVDTPSAPKKSAKSEVRVAAKQQAKRAGSTLARGDRLRRSDNRRVHTRRLEDSKDEERHVVLRLGIL